MRLSVRISLVLTLLTGLAVVASAHLIFSLLTPSLLELEIANLEATSERIGAEWRAATSELARDARLLAGTPPISGIVRARRNGGIDPEDGSSLEEWKQRLAVIFEELLHSKADYVQARYVGASDGGWELVRVNRTRSGGVRKVPESELQRKGHRLFLKRALEEPRSGLYFSAVNLNRERGEIQIPHTPVLRAVMPIHVEGVALGAIVINSSVSAVLERARVAPRARSLLYVTNERGEYLAHPDPDRSFAFEFGATESAMDQFTEFDELADASEEVVSRIDPGRRSVVSARRVYHGVSGGDRNAENAEESSWIGVIVSAPSDVSTVLSGARRRIAWAMLALIGITVGVGLLLARMAARPIRILMDALRGADPDAESIAPPAGLSAEAGELAAALQSAWQAAAHRRMEVEALNRELQAANRELEDVTYMASHDLQEPTRTIAGCVDVLEESLGKEPNEEVRDCMHFIRESCERMRAQIHGLLELGRIGAKSSPERVDLRHVIEGVCSDLSSAIQGSGARIAVSELPVVFGHAVELRMLFQNLVHNAIKFRRPGTEPEVSISAEKRNQGWVISVCDRGIGIGERDRTNVFRMYHRLHDRSQYGGTGIGLAHCRKIVQMHHGRIWIEDNPGGGSHFVFELKLREDI